MAVEMDRKDLVIAYGTHLTIDDRKDVIKALLDSIERDTVDVPSLYAALVSFAEAATGHRLDTRRTRANTEIRMMVAHRLRAAGVSQPETGRLMGRDHATVNWLLKRMDDAISVPWAYRELLDRFNAFNQMADNYDRRTVQRAGSV